MRADRAPCLSSKIVQSPETRRRPLSKFNTESLNRFVELDAACNSRYVSLAATGNLPPTIQYRNSRVFVSRRNRTYQRSLELFPQSPDIWQTIYTFSGERETHRDRARARAFKNSLSLSLSVSLSRSSHTSEIVSRPLSIKIQMGMIPQIETSDANANRAHSCAWNASTTCPAEEVYFPTQSLSTRARCVYRARGRRHCPSYPRIFDVYLMFFFAHPRLYTIWKRTRKRPPFFFTTREKRRYNSKREEGARPARPAGSARSARSCDFTKKTRTKRAKRYTRARCV